MFLKRNCTLDNAIQSRHARVGPGVGVGVGVDIKTPTPESESTLMKTLSTPQPCREDYSKRQRLALALAAIGCPERELGVADSSKTARNDERRVWRLFDPNPSSTNDICLVVILYIK